ncbi:hypothetical protein [Anaerovorax sp. IOR16]|uniref:hypothetical protein n=1 Tax=Anaerovorax sp. IOR16 TaxID=2773458 RepID=UPI0019D091FE|nr:hypothetical protein [Anaerovorax sp. IOR16]
MNTTLFDKTEYGYDMKKDTSKKSLVIQIEKIITYSDIENIVITALEDGIGYWACLNNTTTEWNEKPENMPISQWATELLLTGKSITFDDAEWDNFKDEKLNLEKLLKGIALNIQERPDDCDLDNMDATTADCIIQFALFGEVIYG